MMTREALRQFERLQRESELVVEALRNVVPTITTSPRAYRRPRLSVVPVDDRMRKPQRIRSRSSDIS